MKHNTAKVLSEVMYLERKKRILEFEDCAMSDNKSEKELAWNRVKEIEDTIKDFESCLTQTTYADSSGNEAEIWQFS